MKRRIRRIAALSLKHEKKETTNVYLGSCRRNPFLDLRHRGASATQTHRRDAVLDGPHPREISSPQNAKTKRLAVPSFPLSLSKCSRNVSHGRRTLKAQRLFQRTTRYISSPLCVRRAHNHRCPRVRHEFTSQRQRRRCPHGRGRRRPGGISGAEARKGVRRTAVVSLLRRDAGAAAAASGGGAALLALAPRPPDV